MQVHIVQAKSIVYTQWTKDELGTMLQYHKIKEDTGMATTVAGCQAQWLVRKDRTPFALFTPKRIAAILDSPIDVKLEFSTSDIGVSEGTHKGTIGKI